MWKRVHLAAVDGPDPGHTIELGAAGRGVTPAPPIVVGRGAFADVQIADPGLSREHFAAHAGTSRWGQIGVWIHEAARDGSPAATGRHVRLGRRLRRGTTTFEVRTDAPPRAVRLDGIARILPFAASAGFLAMWIIPGAGPWPLIAAALLTPAGMFLANRVGGGPLPDPARLRRSRHAAPARHTPAATGAEERWTVDLGNATRTWPRKFTITPGDVIGFAGAHSPGLARWVAAQLVHAGGQAAVTHRAGVARFEVEFPASGAGVTILAARAPGFLPSHAKAVLPVRRGHNRNVSADWYEAFLTHAGEGVLPTVVHLADHLPPLAQVPTSWQDHDSRLTAPIGLTSGAAGVETAEIDLAGDAPHAVVAGTTGSGKSELLTSWLCGLAATYPPAHVAMVLIDYKGGATFGQLTRLPHVLGVLTDLEHSHTVRALESLRVEILRRERHLKQHGAANLTEHNARAERPLARLLIVVDEFRVLADEYPDVLDQLVRVAAQGRSLGIHVVLATQRPGGTMAPDIRANMGLRACLRVVEETDSIDLLGTAEAAHLPAIPGRMVLRDDELRTVQTLWAGPPLVGALVDACTQAARAHPELATTDKPWAPALPAPLSDVEPPEAGHIAMGMSDLPEEQRLAPWQIPADTGLTIAGDPASGRTTAATRAARGILDRGTELDHGAGLDRGAGLDYSGGLHVIAPAPLLPDYRGGTFAPVTDPVTCYALLTRLLQTPGADALVIDDANLLVETLEDALGPGEGAPFLQEVLQARRRRGEFTAITTGLPIPAWAHSPHRIIFPPTDPNQGMLAGLSKKFSHPGPPGRAVAVHGGRETLVQVALPPPPSPQTDTPAAAFRILPLPAEVDLPLQAAAAGAGICIGIGGPHHEHVALPCKPGKTTAVVGAPAMGKTRFAHVLAARAAALGRAGDLHIVDDLHTRDAPDLDACDEAVREGRHVVITTSPEGLAAGYHPFIQRLRHADHTVFIGALPRSATGLNLGAYINPGIPGRAAVRARGKITSLQLDNCTAVPHAGH